MPNQCVRPQGYSGFVYYYFFKNIKGNGEKIKKYYSHLSKEENMRGGNVKKLKF